MMDGDCYKNTIQSLCDGLEVTGQETLMLIVNVRTQELSFLGSHIGRSFFQAHPNVEALFFKFCKDLQLQKGDGSLDFPNSSVDMSEFEIQLQDGITCRDMEVDLTGIKTKNHVKMENKVGMQVDNEEKIVSSLTDNEENIIIETTSGFENEVCEMANEEKNITEHIKNNNDIQLEINNKKKNEDRHSDTENEMDKPVYAEKLEKKLPNINIEKSGDKTAFMSTEVLKETESVTGIVFDVVPDILTSDTNENDKDKLIIDEKSEKNISIGQHKVLNDKEKSKINGFRCGLCDGVCPTEHALLKHLISHTLSNGNLDRKDIISTVEIKKCQQCSFTTNISSLYEKHREEEHSSSIHMNTRSASKQILKQNNKKIKDIMYHYKNKNGKLVCGTLASMYKNKTKTNEPETMTHSCNICLHTTKMHSDMHQHVKSHIEIDRHGVKCGFGPKTLHSQQDYSDSSKLPVTKQHDCSKCEKMFASEMQLREHGACHKVPLTCRLCDKTFTMTTSYNRHLKLHDLKTFRCDKCKAYFRTAERLRHHNSVQHATVEHMYRCELCDKEFHQKRQLTRHKKTHDGTNSRKCTICDKLYLSPKGLSLHMATEHIKEKNYMCQLCGKTFFTQPLLQNHLRRHKGSVEKIKCSWCDKVFKLLDDLRIHENVHTRKNVYICDICGEEFYRQPSFRQHRLKHNANYKHIKCRYCDERFRSATAMATHVKNNTHHVFLDLAHACPLLKKCHICGKIFSLMQHYNVHMDLHAGLKRHKCHLCGCSFTDPANLRAHMRSHNSQKNYTCPLCSKQFGQRRHVKIHLKSHKDDGVKYLEMFPHEKFEASNISSEKDEKSTLN